MEGARYGLDRSVAIKILPAEFSQNAQLKSRFEREAKSCSKGSRSPIGFREVR